MTNPEQTVILNLFQNLLLMETEDGINNLSSVFVTRVTEINLPAGKGRFSMTIQKGNAFVTRYGEIN